MIFEEPLFPAASTQASENIELAQALDRYLGASAREDIWPLEDFLSNHPDTAWKVSLLANLAIVARRTGYFSKALRYGEEAWRLGRDAQDARVRALAERGLAEVAELLARLGRLEELRGMLQELGERSVSGSAGERLSQARDSLWQLENRPEASYRCGPLAVGSILTALKGTRDERVDSTPSTARGTSLRQMETLANAVGLRMKMAKRETSDAAILVPAMVHWRAGHFGALVKKEGERYLLQDPTFGEEMWVSRNAVDHEADGYFLVMEQTLPAGWREVAAEEGAGIWGKGAPPSQSPAPQGPRAPKKGGNCPSGECCPPRGMAVYQFNEMLASLVITDAPVGYSPAIGPPVQFTVTYNQREAFQPAVFTCSNVGAMWTFDWISYISDDPTAVGQTLTVYGQGGGQETYTGYNAGTQSYGVHFDSNAVVKWAPDAAHPVRYERALPDGSVEVYAQPDGSLTFPRKVFLSEIRDPQGQTRTYVYDQDLRLVALADALGQVTTLSYELSSAPLQITRVTDPFGRNARLEYDSNGRLSRITDVVGLTSEFLYSGNQIISMTTPYGTTKFTATQVGGDRSIEAVDPLGARELLKYISGHAPEISPTFLPASTVPEGFVNFPFDVTMSFYWDKRAMALGPGDYSKASLTHWMWTPVTVQTSAVARTRKAPLENRVWYAYPGQTDFRMHGTHSSPSVVARILDDPDGAGPLTGPPQKWQYEYNAIGKVIKSTDPVGRETVFIYGNNNTPDPTPATGMGLDLLQGKQKNPASAGGYDVLESRTYNSQHLPLTMTDAAGQTTTYTYNSAGQVLTAVTPPRGGLTIAQRTTTYSYDADGHLQSVTGPATGATTSFTYDGYGRVRTVTDPDSYTTTTDYDALDRATKVTFPDGTFEETVYNRLDAEGRRDRLGRWTHTFYDALQRPLSMRDALGRITTQVWCTCGSLDKLIDANGNATTWERDLQARVTREIRANGSDKDFVYENTTSRLKQITDAKDDVVIYTYFDDDNLKDITYSHPQLPTPNVSFTHDQNYNRPLTIADGTGTTIYTYHPVGQPPALGATRLATVDGPLTNDTISYSYDELGLVATRQINGAANTVSQFYDALGRVTSQSNALGTFNYAYEGVTGRPTTVTYPNGQTTTIAYETNAGDHRLKEIHHKLSGGATLSKFNYTTDAQANIKTWQQQAGTDPAKLYTLGYDAADQLTSADISGVSPLPVPNRFAYTYDKAGNRTTEQLDDFPLRSSYDTMNRLSTAVGGGSLVFKGTVSEGATVTVQGKPATVTPPPSGSTHTFEGKAEVTGSIIPGVGTNTIVVQATDSSGNVRTNTYTVDNMGTGQALTYDANGNLCAKGPEDTAPDCTSTWAARYEWDAENRLVAMKGGATTLASFTYDGQGRRATKTAGGVTRSYVYDGMHVAEERLSGGATGTIRYFHGSGVDDWLGRQETDGSATFFVADHLGSIVQHTNSAGAVTLARSYDPWGNLDTTSGAVSGPAFTGREWDAEVGLYYYRARYYDPKTGRFLSEDPIPVALRRVREVNTYSYVANNPVNWTDPSGQLLWTPAIIWWGVKVAAPYVGAGAAAAGSWAWAWWQYQQPVICQRPKPDPKDPTQQKCWDQYYIDAAYCGKNLPDDAFYDECMAKAEELLNACIARTGN